MTTQEQQEVKAISTLLQSSFPFDVPLRKEFKAPTKVERFIQKYFPFLMYWLGMRFPKKWKTTVVETVDPDSNEKKFIYVRQLKLYPLYLGTIDAIRRLALSIDYNPDALKEDPLTESARLFQYADVLAEIAAVATLNTGEKMIENYDEELQDMTSFYIKYLTSAQLLNLLSVIHIMQDAEAFTTSIGLIDLLGTTKPKPQKPKAKPIE